MAAAATPTQDRSADDLPICLKRDLLYLLGGSVPVDERMSWYDHGAGGHVPFNTYLLRDDGGDLLVEAGVPVTFSRLLSQLRRLRGDGDGPDRIAVTRNEPDCVASLPLLVGQAGLRHVYSPGLLNTLQFFPDIDGDDIRERSFSHGSTELQMLDFGIACTPSIPDARLAVGSASRLKVVAAPLKILPTVWYFDEATGTLFCSDSFSEEVGGYADERVLHDVAPQLTLIERFRRSFARKFDWLERSDLTTTVRALEKVFSDHDIRRLAPNRGLVIEGRAAVQAKQEALLQAMTTPCDAPERETRS